MLYTLKFSSGHENTMSFKNSLTPYKTSVATTVLSGTSFDCATPLTALKAASRRAVKVLLMAPDIVCVVDIFYKANPLNAAHALKFLSVLVRIDRSNVAS